MVFDTENIKEYRLVLMIQNKKINKRELSEDFEKGGFDLQFAANTKSALKFVTKMRPFLILIDLIITGFDSYRFSRILKNDEDTNEIKIIAFSDKNPNHNKILYSGFDGLIYYKGNSKELVSEIRKYI